MSGDVEIYIRQKYAWSKLPPSIKQVLGESQKEYDKLVINFSVKNQLRFRGNLVRSVKKDERAYYEELLRYSRDHLMLYPYHLSDFIVTGMRITPFQYYISMMQDLMEQEKSYDSLPNFTAADCLRLLGIGRNQYIELMNQCRSSKKFFGVRRKPIRDLLPPNPVSSLIIEPWWIVYVGYVTEDDIKVIPANEKIIIDRVIDDGPQKAGDLDAKDVKGLYRKGLIYLDVPIEDNDYVCVPPLEGFVMNRVLGDYLETLLYKIFVSIDEHTTISELASILQIDLDLVKNAVSMYCRLGFAKKKCQEDKSNVHSSWENEPYFSKSSKSNCEEPDEAIVNLLKVEDFKSDAFNAEQIDQVPSVLSSVPKKRIGFLFDSTLTAFLMMGNLSPGLKSHAVTMFEVGKLSDESLDSFLIELLKVADVGEGEARRYFDHALSLRDTIDFLRHNDELICNSEENENGFSGLGLDLLRCESLQNLDQETCSRLLNKNYCLLISMAPLTNEIRPVSSCSPPHLGPPISEVSSVWFKLFLYSITKSGPPSLLLTKGTKLRVLPKVFKDHEKLLVTTWAHDPSTVPMLNALPILNDALCHSAVLVQGQGSCADLYYVPFPFQNNDSVSEKNSFFSHPSITVLMKEVDLIHNCGYITMMKVTTSIPVTKYQGSMNYSFSSMGNGIVCSTSTEWQKQSENSEKWTDYNHMTEAEALSKDDDIPISLHNGAHNSKLTLPLQHSEKTNFKLNKTFNWNEKDWMILDCSFGIPLFNGSLNKEVCQRINTGKLCHHSSLKSLKASNRKLSLQVLQFISNYQPVITNPDSGRHSSFPPNRPGCAMELPLPSVNLFFCGGQLSVWNQK